MADRTLVSLYPEAACPLPSELLTMGPMLTKTYGKLPITYFNLPVYDNPIGIEVEAEKYSAAEKFQLLLFRREEDHSLKHNGLEMVSIPLIRTSIDYALYEIAKMNEANKFNFSHRTSVHVHCNVGGFTWNQLVYLVALYGLLEECFFSFVNETRRGNAFCYRIVGTSPEIILYNPANDEGTGSPTTKYCGFNITPIRRQMTVEFRHLEGTADKRRLRRWIQICAKLVGHAKSVSGKTCLNDLATAITNGTVYETIVPQVWGHTAVIFPGEQVRASIENGEAWAFTVLMGEM